MLDPLSYFSVQSALQDWCVTKAVICSILSVGWYLTKPHPTLLLIGKDLLSRYLSASLNNTFSFLISFTERVRFQIDSV